jgi:hypothetical protein
MEQEQEQLKRELNAIQFGHAPDSETDHQVTALVAKIDRLMQANLNNNNNAGQNRDAGSTVAANPPAPGHSRDWIPLTEEEEELRKLEMMPRDTQLSKLRKAHLQEMITLKSVLCAALPCALACLNKAPWRPTALHFIRWSLRVVLEEVSPEPYDGLSARHVCALEIAGFMYMCRNFVSVLTCVHPAGRLPCA